MSQGITSSTEERALKLLGSGLNPETVAHALGVSASRISQLLSEEDFALQVSHLRFTSLQKHNERDSSYDELEDKLLKKLDDLLPYMTKPMEVLAALRTVNNANRRGASAPQEIHNQQTIVNLTIPVRAVQKFVTNINNQVVQIGDQTLVTMQSGALLSKTKEESSEKTNGTQTAAAITLTNRLAQIKEKRISPGISSQVEG